MRLVSQKRWSMPERYNIVAEDDLREAAAR